MRRAELCKLSNWTSARFKNAEHEGYLPFPTPERATAISGRKWTNYTAHAALLLDLLDCASNTAKMDDLALMIAEASKHIRFNAAKLNSARPETDFWLCLVQYRLFDGTQRRGDPLVGTMPEIGLQLSHVELDYESQMINIAMLNVSEAARRILRRVDDDFDRTELILQLESGIGALAE